MALTVRPDDEVYQFDTVWLGPDEYTLPIQARYVAWGTWLACFLVTAALLIPLGGGGPAGVLGSLVWSLALSVVLSRAVMLVVDHERPLRSLPALFSAEAGAAVAARRRTERALLVRPGRVRVRSTPAKVLAMRERQHRRAEERSVRRRPPVPTPAAAAPIEAELREAEVLESDGSLGPDWRAGGPLRPEWTPDLSPAASGPDDWADWSSPPEPAPAWSVPGDRPYEAVPQTRHPAVPVPARHAAGAPDGYGTGPLPAAARHTPAVPATSTGPADPAGRTGPDAPAVPAVAAVARPRTSPFRPHPTDGRPVEPVRQREEQLEPAESYPGPVTVTPNGGRLARPATGRDERPDRGRQDPRDRQAAVEARILLPVRKDR